MNLVVLKGNLVRDPDVKELSVAGRQTKVANFTVAVSRFYTKANGDKEKDTVFIPCEAWDTGAERIGVFLKKGDPVLVEGSLKTESWEKDGQKHSRTKVRVTTFDKLNRAPGQQSPDTGVDEVPVQETADVVAGSNEEGDIPF